MGVRYVGPTVIEIHDEVLFGPGGDLHRYGYRVRTEIERNARRAAPRNKRSAKWPGNPPIGHLKRSIGSSLDRNAAAKVIGITVFANASYAVYVHEGTRPVIVWKKGYGAKGGFPLPTNNYGPRRRVKAISGQEGQPFLREGYNAARATHSSLPRM